MLWLAVQISGRKKCSERHRAEVPSRVVLYSVLGAGYKALVEPDRISPPLIGVNSLRADG